jgi:cell division protein FtsI/penicillin-binding protein 2
LITAGIGFKFLISFISSWMALMLNILKIFYDMICERDKKSQREKKTFDKIIALNIESRK